MKGGKIEKNGDWQIEKEWQIWREREREVESDGVIWETDRLTDREIDRQTNRQTGKQTDR